MGIVFFTDTHIAKQIAIQLRKNGIQVVRCQDIGMADAEDEDLLKYAAAHQFALLTKDDDFLTLHSRWKVAKFDHYGIFYCPYRDRPAIGLIVTACIEYYALIAQGAGKDTDLKNEVIYIT